MKDDLLEHGDDRHGPLDQDEAHARQPEAAPHGFYRDDNPADVIAEYDGAEGIDSRGQQAGLDALTTMSMEGEFDAPESPQVAVEPYADHRPAETVAADDSGGIDPERQQAGMDALLKMSTPVPPHNEVVHDEETPGVPTPPPHHEKAPGVLTTSQEAAWAQLVAAQTNSGEEKNPAGPIQKYEPQSGDTSQLPAVHDDNDLAANNTRTAALNRVPLNPEVQEQPGTNHVRTQQLEQIPTSAPPTKGRRGLGRVATWVRGGRKRPR